MLRECDQEAFNRPPSIVLQSIIPPSIWIVKFERISVFPILFPSRAVKSIANLTSSSCREHCALSIRTKPSSSDRLINDPGSKSCPCSKEEQIDPGSKTISTGGITSV